MTRRGGVLKWILGVLLVLAIVVGAAAVFLGPMVMEQVRAGSAERGTLIDAERLSRGELTRVVSAPGTVEAREQVNINSRVSATIAELPFEEGDEVRKGDIIAVLDSKDLQAALAAAEARLLAEEAALKAAEARLASDIAAIEGTRASLNRAVADFERQQELFESGDISQSALDAARAEMEQLEAQFAAAQKALDGQRANLEAARAGVEVARADVDRARENVEFATIRAPIDGVITRVMQREGETVLGTIQNIGSVIMTIADLTEMLVRARIAEVDVARVEEGQEAEVHINGYPDRVFSGTLRKLALQSQAGSDGTSSFDAEVVLHLEEGERIFTGLTANVDVNVETLTDTFLVPSQAVLDKRIDELPEDVREEDPLLDTDRTFTQVVYVFADGKAKVKPVRVIASNLTTTAIAEGLAEEDVVIVGPYRALRGMEHDAFVRLDDEDRRELGLPVEGEDGAGEALAEAEGDGDETDAPPAGEGGDDAGADEEEPVAKAGAAAGGS